MSSGALANSIVAASATPTVYPLTVILETSAHKLEPLLQEVFARTGLIEGCKLIRKDKSSYKFMDYFDCKSAAFAIVTLNRRHLLDNRLRSTGLMPVFRDDTSSHFNFFVGDLSPELTDATLFACFSVYPSCPDARVMWDQRTGRSRGCGSVAFQSHR